MVVIFNALVRLWDKKCTFCHFLQVQFCPIFGFCWIRCINKIIVFIPISNNTKYCCITFNMEKLLVVNFNAFIRLWDKIPFFHFLQVQIYLDFEFCWNGCINEIIVFLCQSQAIKNIVVLHLL